VPPLGSGLGVLLELVADLADQLLQDILERHQPAVPPYSSITIASWACCRRNSARAWSSEASRGSPAPPHDVVGLRLRRAIDTDQILHVHDADDVVEVVAIHGKAREAVLPRHRDEPTRSSSSGTATISVRGTMTWRTSVSAKSRALPDDHPLALLEHALAGRRRDQHLQLLIAVDVQVAAA
jgi:hypothetical protein